MKTRKILSVMAALTLTAALTSCNVPNLFKVVSTDTSKPENSSAVSETEESGELVPKITANPSSTNNHDFYDRYVITCKPVHIKRNVWIGVNVTILPGVTIGEITDHRSHIGLNLLHIGDPDPGGVCAEMRTLVTGDLGAAPSAGRIRRLDAHEHHSVIVLTQGRNSAEVSERTAICGEVLRFGSVEFFREGAHEAAVGILGRY